MQQIIYALVLLVIALLFLNNCRSAEERAQQQEGWQGMAVERDTYEGADPHTGEGDGVTLEALRYKSKF